MLIAAIFEQLSLFTVQANPATIKQSSILDLPFWNLMDLHIVEAKVVGR